MFGTLTRRLLALACVLVFGLPLLAKGGPRTAVVSATSCDQAQARAEKTMATACQKLGGVAWSEVGECEGEGTLLPGAPVTMPVHFLCADDL